MRVAFFLQTVVGEADTVIRPLTSWVLARNGLCSVMLYTSLLVLTLVATNYVL